MVHDLADEISELLAVDTSAMTARERTRHMARIEKARSRFEAFTLAQLADFEVSGAFEADAARTPATWLAAQTGTSTRTARSRCNLTRHLRMMRFADIAFRDGAITDAHVRVLQRCVRNPRTCAQYQWDEPYLVGLARQSTADELEQHVRQWLALHDPDGSAPSDPQEDVLHANQVGERVKIDGDLGLEEGLPLKKLIEERADQIFHRDKKVAEANPLDGLGMRTPGNRRAEAFSELIHAGAGTESNPRHREPLFMVLTNPKTFATCSDEGDRRGRPSAFAEMDDGSVIPLPVLEYWRCGAEVSRAYTDAYGAMLSYGRTERYANRELRRALAARDRGCAVPGCDRGPEHCDAHHVIYWENFGPTDIDNLVLLCRRHHRSVHAGRLSIRMVDGVPRFYDADGSLIRKSRHRPEVPAA